MEIRNRRTSRSIPRPCGTGRVRCTASSARSSVIQGIEDIEAAIGDADSDQERQVWLEVDDAEQLAFAAMKAQAAIGATTAGKPTADAQNSGNVGVTPTRIPQTQGADRRRKRVEALPARSNQNKKRQVEMANYLRIWARVCLIISSRATQSRSHTRHRAAIAGSVRVSSCAVRRGPRARTASSKAGFCGE